MGFLTGKKALITGVMSDRSIAYGIAEAMHREGAELAFTYMNESFKDRVAKITNKFNPVAILPCDVSSDEEIDNVFTELKKHWDGLDILIHSIAFAPSGQLEGDYVDVVTREGFRVAHEISSYSFVALAKAARDMMKNREDAALLTLSYHGAERVVPNYNVMGVAKASLEANVRYMANSLGPDNIRVNAVSAGPIRTLAASGVKNFKKLLGYNASVAPLRRNITSEDVGNTSAFLCSTLAKGITGEVLYVDAGFHCITIDPTDLA